MKWTAKNINAALKGKPEDLPLLVLVYGDDSGIIRGHTKNLADLVLPDQSDPFALDRLSMEEIYAEPSRLVDAAATMSFGGGLKLVRIEGATGDADKKVMTTLVDAVDTLLEQDPGGAVVLLPVPMLDAKSPLVKRVEKAKNAASLRCYADNARDLGQFIAQMAQQFNKRVDRDALQFLQDNLGNDRGVTEMELQKLMLYAGEAETVTLDHCLQVIAAAPSANIFLLCDAIGGRETLKADRLLERLHEEGEDPNMVLSMALRHLRRVLECKARMKRGESLQNAMQSLQPPVPSFVAGAFGAQVQKYPEARLKILLDRFYQMQMDTRSGQASLADLSVRRGLLGLSV